VEEYGLDELAASAEAVMAGLGPLAVALAGLAAGARGAVTLDAMERGVTEEGRKLLCGVVQLALDGQAAAEVRVPQVTGADGVPRTRAERGHTRPVVTRLGEVTVRRIAYRSGIKGVPSLFPRDAVLNLPPRGYSWALQQLAVMFCRSGAYEQAHEFVLAVTGVSIGRRQLEQIVLEAAADAERFGQDPARARDVPLRPAAGPEGALLPVALSADGKGVAMRPEARRRRAKAPEQRVRTFAKKTGTGEKKGHKRMAETVCVFDVIPAPRTPEQVMAREPGTPADGPRAVNRWYACDITASRDVAIARAAGEAERRDPGHCRPRIALVDGDPCQIRWIQDQAAQRGITITIIIDFIHVLGYLWKAAWCFHEPRDPAIEDWVTAQGLDILHGRVAEVITRISQLAADRPPRPRSEHAKNIRAVLSYLENKQPYLDYPAALANGWPISTGVIEGACRHLVQDRMGITGARWGLEGAQAMLWHRAIAASGDTSTYWDWHITQEHHRNHLSRYQHDPGNHDNLGLAA
jgi:hypothetical protein